MQRKSQASCQNFEKAFWCVGVCVALSLASGPGSADGQKPLFRSPVLTAETPGQAIDISVDVAGVEELFLVVEDGGDGYSCDWADWIAPRFVGNDDKQATQLTDLKWKSALAQFGTVHVNANCQNGPMIVNGSPVKGIGTHAKSVIHYQLPPNHTYQKFRVTGGLDQAGVSQANGRNTSVRFTIYSKRPPRRFWPQQEVAAQVDHDPENSVQLFEVHPELKVELFASEPMMVNPTNFDIDHLGRVWVCEVVNYRNRLRGRESERRPEGDRILILEDTDGDARADKSTVFYQGTDIDSAHGICVLGNRALISAGDSVFYLIDVDGDSVADKKEVLFTGISGVQHDHGIHAFVFGPDGKLYFNFGNNGRQICDRDGEQITDLAGNPVRDNREPYQQGMVFRCNLDGSELETLAWNFRNNWEVCIDSFGRIWQSDNDDDGNRGVRINFVMPFGNYGYRDALDGSGWREPRSGWADEIPKRHWHQNDPGVVPNLLHTGAGSPTGICFYEGDLLPGAFQQQIIHCDAGPNIARAYPIKPVEAGFAAEVINILDGAEQSRWFRPSDVAVAPDGSLLIADWYDSGVGGHGMADRQRGRIYRVSPKRTQGQYRVNRPDFETPSGACRALASPNLATRHMAFVALEKMGPTALPSLEQMRNQGPVHLRARAYWVADEILRTLGRPSIMPEALRANEPLLQEMAIRWTHVEPSLKRTQSIWDQLEISKIQSKGVLREVALALSKHRRHSLPIEAKAKIWAELALRYQPGERWFLEALGIGADGHWDQCLSAYLERVPDWKKDRGAVDIIWRSRSRKSPNLLVALLRDENGDIEQIPRLFRSLDFVSPDESLLADLAFEVPPQSIREQKVFSEAIHRISAQSLSEPNRVVLEKYAAELPPGELFVELVSKFGLDSQYTRLFQLIRGDDKQLANDALITLTQNGQLTLLQERLVNADDEAFAQFLGAMGRSGNFRIATEMGKYARTKANPLSRRKLAVLSMAKINSGAKALIRWLEKKNHDPQLEPAISAGLHSAPWRDVSRRASEFFPLPQSKGELALPAIADLIRRKGDPANGKLVFQKQGTCADCHQVKGQGKEVGPDLSEIGSKLSRRAMLESILFPSAAISHNYENWSVLTDDGTMVTGLLLSETEDEIKICDREGIVHAIATQQVDQMKQQNLSLMPADLHKQMTPQELIDVVDYMQTLKTKSK